jgi:hypothetical protein
VHHRRIFFCLSSSGAYSAFRRDRPVKNDTPVNESTKGEEAQLVRLVAGCSVQ